MVSTTGGKADCREKRAGYRLTSLECPEDGRVTNYEGETGRNVFSRGLEHGLTSSVLWKHCMIQHSRRQVSFRMDVLKTFKLPLERQNFEGVRVKCSEADILMNSKNEFHQPSIVRVVAFRGNTNEEQAEAEPNPAKGRGRGGSRGSRSTMDRRNQGALPCNGGRSGQIGRRGARPSGA